MLSRVSRDNMKIVPMATMGTIAHSHKDLAWRASTTTWLPWLPREWCQRTRSSDTSENRVWTPFGLRTDSTHGHNSTSSLALSLLLRARSIGHCAVVSRNRRQHLILI